MFSSKKGAGLSLEVLIVIILLSLFLISVVSVLWAIRKEADKLTIRESLCAWTIKVKSEVSFLSKMYPSLCRVREIREELEEEKQIVSLLRNCWAMYGAGEIEVIEPSYLTGMDTLYDCYMFKTSSTIPLRNVTLYMLTHDVKGNVIQEDEIKNSAYANFQRKGSVNSLCFDNREAYVLENFERGRFYFIRFRDDHQDNTWLGEGNQDQVIISEDSDFSGNFISGNGKNCREFWDTIQ